MAGRVVHFEIPIDDADRATTFYERALGWKPERWGPIEYWTVDPGEGEGIGGALATRDDPSSTVVIYIDVDDIEATLKEVEAAGGRRLTEPRPIPTVGWNALFQDSEGNAVGLFQADPAVTFPG